MQSNLISTFNQLSVFNWNNDNNKREKPGHGMLFRSLFCKAAAPLYRKRYCHFREKNLEPSRVANAQKTVRCYVAFYPTLESSNETNTYRRTETQFGSVRIGGHSLCHLNAKKTTKDFAERNAHKSFVTKSSPVFLSWAPKNCPGIRGKRLFFHNGKIELS